MPLSTELADKSVQAAIAAIEIYNKPNFSFREEAFALLMTNAWELLLKAKWVLDRGEAPESLYELIDDGKGGKGPKKINRSGNPLSHGVTYLAAKMVEDKNSGVERGCHDNILALVEIRDNAAHFLNKDLYIGSASSSSFSGDRRVRVTARVGLAEAPIWRKRPCSR